MAPLEPKQRLCVFMGSSRRDLLDLPTDVRQEIGYALYVAQAGDEPVQAKALKGFGGRSVLEIVSDFDSDTYRTVYTVRFAEVLYVLHVFQKKAKRGSETPRHDIDLVRQRLQAAELHYRQNFNDKGPLS